MNRSTFSRLCFRLWVTLHALALPSAAQGEDIEIFFTANTQVIKPNVLLIVDTSGTMDSLGKFGAPYDPGQSYAGPCTDAYRYYYRTSTSTTVPSCAAGDDNYIVADNFQCEAARSALDAAGYYVDRIQEWRVFSSPYWGDLYNNTRISDCMADDGVHGASAGSSAVYAATGASDGPYTSNAASTSRIDWGNRKAYKIYTKNYMNWYHTVGNVNMRRIDAVKAVLRDLASSVNGVKLGMQRFSDNSAGGMIVHPVVDVAAGGNRAALLAEIDMLDIPDDGGSTPMAENFWEAYLYYTGNAVRFGLGSTAMRSGVENVSVPSVATSRDAGDPSHYASPLEMGCQRCVIVFLTDGADPTGDSAADAWINALPNFRAVTDVPGDANGCKYTTDSSSDDCVDELAKYLRDVDLRQDVPGMQRITTHVVGFTVDHPYLESIAAKGGGRYFTVSDTAALANALTQIITEVLEVNTSFTAPSVSISAYNRTQHSNDVFFTVFRPATTANWDGNLKKYRFAAVGGEAKIVDASGAPAVDESTGYFRDDARSLWTAPPAPPDGQDVAAGGAAALLDLPRKIYTWLGATANLAASANAVDEGNSSITQDMVGASSAAERAANLRWAAGLDVTDVDDDGDVAEARRRMGDPLHSKPAIVSYRVAPGAVEPLLYFGTNDGLLHAIDGTRGTERFAFIPVELLPNLQPLRSGAGGKVYGMDGPVVALLQESVADQIVDAGAGEAALVVAGMRRGGRSYYALDVTDPDAPRIAWTIHGGSGDFVELGQSWSRPVSLRVSLGGTVVEALAFGGGYDEAQDSVSTSIDSVGRALYIVDARTGARLWWAGPAGSGADLELPAMTNSMPADLKVIDINDDGLADRFYAADTGGRVWRFDIRTGAASAAELVAGGAIAKLGQGGDAAPKLADNRRFFSTPDVTFVSDRAHGSFLAINVGSGYRAHPLNKQVSDMFFSIRDPHVTGVPPNYDYGITVSSLYDATSNVIGQGTAAERTAALNSLFATHRGWYVRLGVGEKTLSEAVTFDEKVMFTTYTPSDPSNQSTACVSDAGLGRFYVVAQRTAEPVVDLSAVDMDPDDGGGLDANDRAVDLVHRGIAAEAAILFPEASDGRPEVYVGTEQAPIDLGNNRVTRTYWREIGR
jgi:type IV pilus assembly protein PilY1